ncbi:hypothetical protein D3C85_1268800 [compost metagenome]
MSFKEVEVGGVNYIVKKFRALVGLKLQQKIFNSGFLTDEGVDLSKLDADVIAELIINGAAKGSVNFDMKKFDTEFAGKYAEIYQLALHVIEFNFLDPNAEAGSEE